MFLINVQFCIERNAPDMHVCKFLIFELLFKF